jgi:hypothetical protein
MCILVLENTIYFDVYKIVCIYIYIYKLTYVYI